MTSSIMTSSINQYLVKINTGVPYPYYNTVSYGGDQYNGDFDNKTREPGKEYTEIFEELIRIEAGRQSYGEPNALLLCNMMRNIENKKVNSYELDNFKSQLDKYFLRKTWSFDNLSDLQILQLRLAKFAVALYESKLKQLQEQE